MFNESLDEIENRRGFFSMEMIVLIKQVPEIGEAKIDPETGTLNRKGIPLTINPIDLNAIELAIQIKEEHGGRIRVLIMGPES